MMRKTVGVMAVLTCAVIALTAAGGAGADPSERRASCGYQQLGSTYNYSITARRTSCDKARAVAKAFTKCRKQNGGANGHCNSPVKRFDCGEDRYDANEFQYSSDVVCRRNLKKVKFSYTQNT